MSAGPSGRSFTTRFGQIPGPVWSQRQPADRVVSRLVDGDGVVDGVVDVFARDVVTRGRAENPHRGIVLRNLMPGT
jgi:hypothetical protein